MKAHGAAAALGRGLPSPLPTWHADWRLGRPRWQAPARSVSPTRCATRPHPQTLNPLRRAVHDSCTVQPFRSAPRPVLRWRSAPIVTLAWLSRFGIFPRPTAGLTAGKLGIPLSTGADCSARWAGPVGVWRLGVTLTGIDTDNENLFVPGGGRHSLRSPPSRPRPTSPTSKVAWRRGGTNQWFRLRGFRGAGTHPSAVPRSSASRSLDDPRPPGIRCSSALQMEEVDRLPAQLSGRLDLLFGRALRGRQPSVEQNKTMPCRWIWPSGPHLATDHHGRKAVKRESAPFELPVSFVREVGATPRCGVPWRLQGRRPCTVGLAAGLRSGFRPAVQRCAGWDLVDGDDVLIPVSGGLRRGALDDYDVAQVRRPSLARYVGRLW